MLQHLAPSGDCVSLRGTKNMQTKCLLLGNGVIILKGKYKTNIYSKKHKTVSFLKLSIYKN
jgi:hypothetical protein